MGNASSKEAADKNKSANDTTTASAADATTCPDSATMAEYIDIVRPESIQEELSQTTAFHLVDGKLVPRGRSLERHPVHHWTPLTAAARHGFTKVAKELIAFGQCFYEKDGNGESPRQVALKFNHQEFADLMNENYAEALKRQRKHIKTLEGRE